MSGTYNDWRSRLHAAFSEGSGADLEDRVAGVLTEALAQQLARHEAAVEQHRSKAKWQQENLEAKLTSLRSAATVEAQNHAAQLKAAANAEVQVLRDEMEAVQQSYRGRIEEAAATEQQLLQKLSMFDGGRAAAELEQQRYMQHMMQRALRRMQNAKFVHCWEAWVAAWEARKKLGLALRRMRNVSVRNRLLAWAAICEQRAEQTRMLRAAAGRLMRPALSGSFSHWRRDWQQSAYAAVEAHRDEALRRVASLKSAVVQTKEEAERQQMALTAGAAAERQRLVDTLTAVVQETERKVLETREALIEQVQRTNPTPQP